MIIDLFQSQSSEFSGVFNQLTSRNNSRLVVKNSQAQQYLEGSTDGSSLSYSNQQQPRFAHPNQQINQQQYSQGQFSPLLAQNGSFIYFDQNNKSYSKQSNYSNIKRGSLVNVVRVQDQFPNFQQQQQNMYTQVAQVPEVYTPTNIMQNKRQQQIIQQNGYSSPATHFQQQIRNVYLQENQFQQQQQQLQQQLIIPKSQKNIAYQNNQAQLKNKIKSLKVFNKQLQQPKEQQKYVQTPKNQPKNQILHTFARQKSFVEKRTNYKNTEEDQQFKNQQTKNNLDNKQSEEEQQEEFTYPILMRPENNFRKIDGVELTQSVILN